MLTTSNALKRRSLSGWGLFIAACLLLLGCSAPNPTPTSTAQPSPMTAAAPPPTGTPLRYPGPPAAHIPPASYPLPAPSATLPEAYVPPSSWTPDRSTTVPSPTLDFTLTPLPKDAQNVQHFTLLCTRIGRLLRCSDDRLGLRFQYPAPMGQIQASLVKGTCGGYFYGYQFDDPRNARGGAGGVSRDYCRQIDGGGVETFFHGFEPGRGCSQLDEARDCQEINPRVFLAYLYPRFDGICDPGPGVILNPSLVVGISLAGQHPVGGLAFTFDFLSAQAKTQLFAPFGGDTENPQKCAAPQTEADYARQVKEISAKVQQGSLDEQTARRVQEIQDIAASIVVVEQ